METNDFQSQTEDFVFDTSGGISVEEQQEILQRINSLSVEKGIVPQAELPAKTKKKGFLFPLIVNIAALLILALGFALLWFTFSRDEQDIREGSAVLNLTERLLIQEIRRETNRQLIEKENEISDILSSLAEAGAEYQELQFSIASLSEAQMERADYLLRLQDEYRNTLSVLQNERTGILEDSRIRELGLRSQAEERLKELSTRIEQSQAGLAAAMEELAQLSGEQDKAAAVEAQLGGYYTILDSQLRQGQNEDALLTITAMRTFLNSPLFLTSRSFESIKQNQLAALSVLERNIGASGLSVLPVDNEGTTEQLAAAEQRSALEQRIEEQERIIAALTSEGSAQGNLAAAYEQSIAELRNDNSGQQQQITRLTDTNNQLQGSVRDLTREKDGLQQRINSLPQVVERAIEDPSIQDQLGPVARQALHRIIVEAIQEAVQ